MKRSAPVALLLGPSLEAMSGVSTHVRSLLDSPLAAAYCLVHFQVGSEGRTESALARLARFFFSPFLLAAAILRHDASIVHVNVSLNAKAYWRDLLHVLAAKLCGARVVLQKHGGRLESFASNRAFARFLRWTLGLPDAVVVLSQAELRQYEEFVPGQTIVAVPNGIDPAPYLKCGRPAADPAEPLKLAYIGRLAPGKGLAESVQALAIARDRGIAARLVIAGSGPEGERLRAQVRGLGLQAQVRFAGPAFGGAKIDLLCSADALLLPSYSEGLPYSLLEGMAAGAVPIVTPVGAIPDVVTEGLHARFVPVGSAEAIAQAIAALHADRAGIARMRDACRRRVAAAYSLERLAMDFGGLYSRLLPWQASQAG